MTKAKKRRNLRRDILRAEKVFAQNTACLVALQYRSGPDDFVCTCFVGSLPERVWEMVDTLDIAFNGAY